MNKELYIKFRNLEKRDNERIKRRKSLYEILLFEDYFKDPKSKEALINIKEYIKKLECCATLRRELKKAERLLTIKCKHEVIVKSSEGNECAICRKQLEIPGYYNGIILDFKRQYFYGELLDTIYETIDYIIENNLDIINNFEEIFKEKILNIDNDIKQNLTLRRMT